MRRLKEVITKRNLFMMISTIVTVSIIFTTQIFATTITGKFYLAKGVTYSYLGQKTTNDDYFTISLPCVSPYSDFTIPENYTNIKVGMLDANGNTILNPRIISESRTDLRTVSYNLVRNLSSGDVFAITLQGNNPNLSAYTQITMYWR